MTKRSWIGVASAAHVRRGRALGFMQLGHGKAAPLRRLAPGDRILYYSPTVTLGANDRLQAFTAIGTVGVGEPYLAGDDQCGCMWRRNVDWMLAAQEAPIRPLLDTLDFAAGGNWGYRLRFGLFEIGDADGDRIAAAMARKSLSPAGEREGAA